MNEMQCDEDKIEYRQGNTSSPSNHTIGIANIKFPPQRSKTSRIKGFDENITQLSQCISSLYLSTLHGLSRSGDSLLYVLLPHEKLGFGISIWH
jgi:hypothetical protein